MTTKFSPYLCGFQNNHNTQYSLLQIIETWKNIWIKEKNRGNTDGLLASYYRFQN